ncbi:MAG: helix-turn-helix domain-containing protein [Sphingobium sp.]|nr:helix-turn-helix domain-containing protein [Sphingobium sp.]
MATIHRLSTAAVPEPQRLAYWKDIFASGHRPIDIDARSDGFEGILTTLNAGELEIMSVQSTPLITRSAAHAASEDKRFSLQLVNSGRCHMRHGEAELIADTADMFVADAARAYELAFSRPVQGLVLSIPWSRFRDHAGQLEELAGRPVNRGGGPAAVLSGFVRSAWNQLIERDGEEWPESATEVIWDLLAATMRRKDDPYTTSRRSDHLRRKAAILVDGELSDPEFRAVAIAEGLGVSARYLQLVLAEVGTTPSEFLLARRLDAAAARLRHPGGACRITDIAFECGFNDLSYFSRTFRRRFGVSARRYRSGRDAILSD